MDQLLHEMISRPVTTRRVDADSFLLPPCPEFELDGVLMLTLPSVASASWARRFTVRLNELRAKGYRIVAESDVLTSVVDDRRLARLQRRLLRHADRVGFALARHGLIDGSAVDLALTGADILVDDAAPRLEAWRWWHIALELPIHLCLLHLRSGREFALAWEWLDSAEIQCETRVDRAAELLRTAADVDGLVAVVASPVIVAYLAPGEFD